jgi:branched-chain amino acid transport system substrate-binding protein
MGRFLGLTVITAALCLSSAVHAQATIRIGLSGPFSGPAAAAAEWEKWGVDQAVEEINAAGGLLGKKVEVVTLDNRCNPTEGVNTARKLVQDKVTAIVGGHCSSATLAMMPIIQEARIPMITGVSSGPTITTLSGAGGNQYMFRISPDDQRMAQGLTEYLGAKKLYKTVAIIGEDSDFGRGGATTFAPLAQKAGMTILSTDYAPQMTPDYTPLLTRVAAKKPDAIAVFMLGGDSLNFHRTAMQMGLTIPFTGRAELGGKNLELIQAGGMDGSVSAWTYSSDIDTPANKKFGATMLAKHKIPPTLQNWAGYDCIQVIAQAIRDAKSDDPVKVRDAMAKVKITGLHGRTLAFDSHNQAGRLVVIQQVKDRKVQVLDLYELK